MSKVVVAVLMGFAVTLAAVVGHRMSGEAVAVVVGVICGVAASVPMSVLIVLVVNRGRQRAQVTQALPEHRGGHFGAYPPVVVIQGGTPVPNDLATPYYGGRALTQPIGQRPFRVVGQSGD
jgi:hypothetical protein